MVTHKPEMLIAVSLSSNTSVAVDMVTTSLKMPAIDNVTTEVRCSRAYSHAVMRKAMVPGNKSSIGARTPHAPQRPLRDSMRAGKPSVGMAMTMRVKNMTGVRKKMLENGLEVAGLRSRRIWVRPQRKPEKKAAEMIRTKPSRSKLTSPATIMMTPAVMVAMMATSLHVGASSLKRKANIRTKASEEDLHIART